MYLGVDDKDQCSCSPEDHLVVERRVKKVDLPWEVPDLEVDKGAVGDILPADLVGALQEQRLTRGHFVKDNFLYGRLAAPSEAHEQDSGLHLSAEGVAEVQHWRNHGTGQGELSTAVNWEVPLPLIWSILRYYSSKPCHLHHHS